MLETLPERKTEQKGEDQNSLDSIVDYISSKIVKGRITEPFEMIVDRKLVTESSLIKYASLPIECRLYFNINGELVIATGSKGSTKVDYGDEIESLRKTYEKLLRKAQISDREIKSFEEIASFIPLFAIKDSEQISDSQLGIDSSFLGHNHPSKKLFPSMHDLVSSSKIKSEVDFIFTDEGVVFFKATEEQMARYGEYTHTHFVNERGVPFVNTGEILEEFVRKEGIVKKKVLFGTREMQNVVAFLKGKVSFDKV